MTQNNSTEIQHNKSVIAWLLTGCLLVFIMVVVGGITRLTHSGLSMTDWHLVTDTFPPMTDSKWQEEFEAYKQFPEYQIINKHNNFTLDDYKSIYFWEWFHRFIGRIIGLVFIIPFVYFLITKKINKKTFKECLLLLFMGALQGFFGWYMVKSGLIDRPDVSHYRLALHLITAFITFALTLWTALNLIYPQIKSPIQSLKKTTQIILIFLLIQIVYGGFVAGLDAGKIHNTWPTMNEGKWVHESVFIEKNTLILNLLEGKSGVQLVHRTLAFIVLGLIIFLYVQSKKFQLNQNQHWAINSIVGIVILQFILGVFTLLFSVPLWLGVAHQVGAFFLLTATTYALHRFSK